MASLQFKWDRRETACGTGSGNFGRRSYGTFNSLSPNLRGVAWFPATGQPPKKGGVLRTRALGSRNNNDRAGGCPGEMNLKWI